MLVCEHAGIFWFLLAPPATLGWDCVYSTGPIVAEGNQEGGANGANASYMAETKAQANILFFWQAKNLWKTQHFPELAGKTRYTN